MTDGETTIDNNDVLIDGTEGSEEEHRSQLNTIHNDLLLYLHNSY